MITIIQQPAAINFSLSLLRVKLTSTDDQINAKLSKGADLIVDEVYDLPPNGQALELNYEDLVDLLLTAHQPDYNSAVSVHEDTVADFTLQLIDSDNTQTIAFRAIKGFVRRQPFDVEGFLRDNWLNLVPQINTVHYHQPLYLTAYPETNVVAYAKAKMKTGLENTIALGTLEANKLQSVELNPGKMIYRLGGEYEYFDVYTMQGSVIRNGYKRFYFTDRFEYNADTFFYLNRLGGWDSLVLTGERTSQNSNNISTALIDEYEHEYNQVQKLEFEKNSGWISYEEHRRQCVDFLYSKQRYHLHEGALRRIVLNNSELNHTKGELTSFSFVFRHSDSKIAYPEIGIAPYHLEIK